MKPSTILLACLLPAAVAVHAESADQAAVRAAEAAQLEASLKGDTAALAALTADDYLEIDPDGSTMDKAESLKAYGPGLFNQASIESSTVRVYGDTAVDNGVFLVTPSRTKVPGRYRFTTVWRKGEDGHWRMVLGHMTTIPAPKPQ